MRDSVLIYRSFAEAIEHLSDEDAGRLYKAITKYAMDGIEPEFSGLLHGYFVLIKPQIDANNQRYENGLKGGRPSTKKPLVSDLENQNITDGYENGKPNHNQTETKPKPKEKEKEKEKVNEKDNDIDKPKRSRFVPPTQTELLDFCIDNNLNIDEEAFIDYYSSKGWKVGSQPMKDWKAAARNWARREKEYKPKQTVNKSGNNLGLFGDYKQTSSDDEWDGLTRAALKDVNHREDDNVKNTYRDDLQGLW